MLLLVLNGWIRMQRGRGVDIFLTSLDIPWVTITISQAAQPSMICSRIVPILVANTWPNGDRSSSRSNKWGRYNWKCPGNHHSLYRPWRRATAVLEHAQVEAKSGNRRELQSNKGWQDMVVHKSFKHLQDFNIQFPPESCHPCPSPSSKSHNSWYVQVTGLPVFFPFSNGAGVDAAVVPNKAFPMAAKLGSGARWRRFLGQLLRCWSHPEVVIRAQLMGEDDPKMEGD